MKKLLKGISIALFWVAVWQCVHMAVGKTVLVPSPLEVASTLKALAVQPEFWMSSLMSLWRVVAGFIEGLAAGILLAVLTSSSKLLAGLMRPMISVIRATPVASFIILALVWLETGRVPVFTSLLIVLPVVWANVSEGIASVDGELLEMAAAFKMKPVQRLRRLYIPSVRPYLSAAATTSLGMAWKAGIAAEVIVSPQSSIGSSLRDSKVYLDTPGLFAWTLVVIAMSMVLEKLLTVITKRAGRRGCA